MTVFIVFLCIIVTDPTIFLLAMESVLFFPCLKQQLYIQVSHPQVSSVRFRL